MDDGRWRWRQECMIKAQLPTGDPPCFPSWPRRLPFHLLHLSALITAVITPTLNSYRAITREARCANSICEAAADARGRTLTAVYHRCHGGLFRRHPLQQQRPVPSDHNSWGFHERTVQYSQHSSRKSSKLDMANQHQSRCSKTPKVFGGRPHWG